MKVWLKEAEIIENNSSKEYKITTLGKKLKELGVDNPLTWAVIWTNLVRNSALINWYVNNVPWGSNYSKKEMIEMLDNNLAQSTRDNAITSLVGILRDTPLGLKLGLGEVETKGRQAVAIIKRGWNNVNQIAILYALYRYAEKIGRHDLYLGELYESACEGPYTNFGIDREGLAGILRGLSSRWGGWISVELVKDLDNIYLDKSHTAKDVLNLE
jgi:phosphoadenosine phosphosulfate reductase